MTDIKVALVTGAASGMGRISAKRLAADGVHVAAVDVNTEGLNELKQESNNISIFPCDLSDGQAVKEMVNQVTAQAEFKANAKVIMAADKTIGTILNIKS